MKKFQKTMSGCLAIALLSGCFGGCVKQVGVQEKSDISYLYVNTRDCGYGDGYLKALEPIFEERYAQTSFAEGKTGVDLVVATSANLAGVQYRDTMANSTYNVSVFEGMYYFDYLAGNYLYDITKIVKNEQLADGTGTIENKLFDDQKAALTADNGKYYVLPVFAGISGITYDADLFEDNFLYFADADGVKPTGNSSYTGAPYTGRGIDATGMAKRSPGPDGKYNTYDDGLPSSYEEFFWLLDTMVEMSITPLVWTGNSQHYTNYLFEALLGANSSKAELLSHFTFDSGDEEVEIIKSFNGDTPVTENVKITLENGYLASHQKSRYEALKFLQHIFNTNEKYYDSRCTTSALSNTQAQKVFEESSLDPLSQDIAMLLEGGYWYNEAQPELQESVGKYGVAAKNRNFKYMPLPAIETGTVNENEGSTIVLADAFNIYAAVNNNIKDDAEKVMLAETFVKFMYEDASLQLMNTTTGVPVAVNYELTETQKAGLDNYPRSLWDIYDFSKDNGAYATTMSANSVFMNHTDKFGFKTTTKFFTSYIGGIEYSYPNVTFWNGKANAKTYFEGMKLTANEWTTTYYKN